jgi:hypothetical protein
MRLVVAILAAKLAEPAAASSKVAIEVTRVPSFGSGATRIARATGSSNRDPEICDMDVAVIADASKSDQTVA